MKFVKLLLSIILCACTTNVSATVNDTTTINKLLKQYETVRIVNRKEAKKIAIKCIELSKSAKYNKGLAQAFTQLGMYYTSESILDSALFFYLKAEKTSMQYAPSLLPIIYVNIGCSYLDATQLDSAIYYYNKALKSELLYPDLDIVACVQTNLIDIYIAQNELKNVQNIAPTVINNYKKSKDHCNLGRLYYHLGEYYLSQNINMGNTYMKEALTEAKVAKDSTLIYTLNTTMATDLAENKQAKEAELMCNEALLFFKKSNDTKSISFVYAQLQLIELGKYNYTKALRYLDSSYTYVNYESNYLPNEEKLIFYEDYALLHEKLGNYKMANEYLKKINGVKDSLNNKINNSNVLQFQTKYETKLKENKIQLQDLQLSKHAQTRNFIILFFCALIAVGIFIYFKNKKTQQKNRANEQIKARKDILELQQQLLRTQMTPHFIFNAVDSIQSLIYTNQNEQAVIYLNKFAKLTRQILENSTQAHIPLADEVAMLHNYLSVQQLLYNAKFSYTLTLANDVDAELLLVPPMLTQPCIENAIKHGLKNKTENGIITIRFYMQNTALLFEVTDNGEGLAPNNNTQHKSLATTIVNQRLTNSTGNINNKITTTNIIVNNIITGVNTTFEIPYICEN